MYLNTKRHINAIYDQVFFKIAKVDLIKLSNEDIAKYKLYSQMNEYEPMIKKRKYEINENNVLESNFSESKTCNSQTQLNITINDGEENERKKIKNNDSDNLVDDRSANSIIVKIESECIQPLEVVNYTDSHTVDTTMYCDTGKLFKTILNNETQVLKNNDQESFIDDKITISSIENIDNLCDKSLKTIEFRDMTRCCDTGKLIETILNNETQVLENNDQESFVNDKSTINSIENIVNLCDESLKTIERINSLKVGKIWCRDMRDLIEISKLEKYCENFGLTPKIPLTPKNSEEKPEVIIPINQISQHSVKNKDKLISLIEFLYQKYFKSKFVQNNIIIIANILNIIRVYDAHHKAQMDSLGHNRIIQNSERYSCNVAISMYLKNSNVLKSKFKKHFSAVLSDKIVDSDFELVFKMFTLSIFNKLKVLNHQESNENIFKNLAHLLWDCLKDSELKTITILKSETFLSNCMDFIRVIDDWWDCDPIITDRMPLLFKSSINNQQHIFQKIINTVTSRNPNENLALLIDIAALQCFSDTKLNNSMHTTPSATVQLQRFFTN